MKRVIVRDDLANSFESDGLMAEARMPAVDDLLVRIIDEVSWVIEEWMADLTRVSHVSKAMEEEEDCKDLGSLAGVLLAL
ncbi:uncharacterized protein A4U43_C02F12790 [Asparagus officinalis]|uniref:Uncharacterized protein n=1 Tax=Asparagus officinalis TaxID=4686 RepID=A0A5P1FI23_ASPOF|nr:uncharacterized protein A4U43_C02F12790 [Asparagus officinalis]